MPNETPETETAEKPYKPTGKVVVLKDRKDGDSVIQVLQDDVRVWKETKSAKKGA